MVDESKTKAHEEKINEVKKLADKIKNAKTLMIVSVKGLPSRQFQDIKKTIRDNVLIKIAKKNILNRSIKELGKESILPLEKEIKENCAFAISGLEGFELAGILSRNKNPIFAKAGQIAPEDIEVKAGPTNLMPGPAISELGALGIQIAVEDGKISIKEPRVIIRVGQEINENAASILQKLDIKPFNIGLEPVAFYDVQKEKIYSNIKIDTEEAVENLKICAGKSLGFAQKLVYYCKDTIGYLLAKANSHGDVLDKLSVVEGKVEEVAENKEEIKDKEEKPVEDVKEDAQENKSEEEK